MYLCMITKQSKAKQSEAMRGWGLGAYGLSRLVGAAAAVSLREEALELGG